MFWGQHRGHVAGLGRGWAGRWDGNGSGSNGRVRKGEAYLLESFIHYMVGS